MAGFHFSTPYILEGREVPSAGAPVAPAQNAMEKMNTTHPVAQISNLPYRRASSLLALKISSLKNREWEIFPLPLSCTVSAPFHSHQIRHIIPCQ